MYLFNKICFVVLVCYFFLSLFFFYKASLLMSDNINSVNKQLLKDKIQLKKAELNQLNVELATLENNIRIQLRDCKHFSPLPIKDLEDIIQSYLWCKECKSLDVGGGCFCQVCKKSVVKDWITYGDCEIKFDHCIVPKDPRDLEGMGIMQMISFHYSPKHAIENAKEFMTKNDCYCHDHFEYGSFNDHIACDDRILCHCFNFDINLKYSKKYNPNNNNNIIPAGALIRFSYNFSANAIQIVGLEYFKVEEL